MEPTALSVPAENSSRPPKIDVDAADAPWERQIAAVRGQHPRGGKDQARRLFAILQHLPEEALGVAAERAIVGLADEDYAAVALPVITDQHTHAQVLSVLFADLMERPDLIALPALVGIARNDAHPFASAALDNLRLLRGEDFGRDWERWTENISAAPEGMKAGP